MQVNKALYTCTSWYANAAMFGMSFGIRIINISGTAVCTICRTGPKLRLHLAVFCRRNPLACISLYKGVETFRLAGQACMTLALPWPTCCATALVKAKANQERQRGVCFPKCGGRGGHVVGVGGGR